MIDRLFTALVIAIVCVVIVVCVLFVANASAAMQFVYSSPQCKIARSWYNPLTEKCYPMNRVDFTLTNTSSRIDFAAFGEGTAGAAPDAGAPDAGPAPDGPSPDGPATDAGPSGGEGGDSGGDAGDGPGGCAY